MSFDANQQGDYCLTMKVKCEVKFGESLYVVGSIQELGNWKKCKC